MSSWASQVHFFHQPVCYRLTAPLERSTCPYQRSLLSFRMRSRFSMQSDHCPVIPLQMLEVWFCQRPSLTGMEHCTPYTRAVLKERWREKRTGSSSLNFFQVLWLKVHSHLLLRASLLDSKRKLPPPACQVRLGLPSVICHPRSVQFPGTVYICNQGSLSNA